MGLLDDAIREHLELKRRHGADPEEVSRQEREALGAPVRGEFAQPDAGEGPEGPAADDEQVAARPATEVEDGPDSEEAQPAEAPDEVEPPPEEAAAAADPGDEEDPWLVDELADPPGSRATVPAGEPDEPEAADGEDVLEETPEFLQETPEHERLWFEQKPPRDFDWDK